MLQHGKKLSAILEDGRASKQILQSQTSALYETAPKHVSGARGSSYLPESRGACTVPSGVVITTAN